MTHSLFLREYVRAALFSETDNANEQGGEALDKNYTIDDIAPETLAKMKNDCEAFQAANAEDLAVRDTDDGAHDFWYTRNGHGAGFWDGDWPQEIGQRLTAASKAFGEFDLYVGDDGKIHGGWG